MNGQRALALVVGDQRWALQGGDVVDGELQLRIAVVNGEDVARHTVSLSIDAIEGGEISVGCPVVSQGWEEAA